MPLNNMVRVIVTSVSLPSGLTKISPHLQQLVEGS
jgi:hypothetical protein